MNLIPRFLTSVCLACPMIVLAQTAQLSGVVKDKTGAVVPQAEVTLTNTATAAILHSKTSKVGFFIFSSVQPGRYNLSAEAPGFDKTLIQDVKLDVAANVSLDMMLQIKQGVEQITVTENAQVNDTDGTVSTVIPHELIENMPLNGNDLQTLFELTPGTLLNAAGGSPAYGGGFSVDGQRPTANYTTVDGVSANSYVAIAGQNTLGSGIATSASGGTNGILPVDAIEEYRMDTSTYTAENGRTPGGQIQIRTRSGTNKFHGTLFENFRNQVLDANDWFSNYDGIKQAQLRMNEFGGTLGGPVLIPHLFDGRHTVFFFVSSDNLIFDQPNTQTNLEVPDASILSGAYSVFKSWLPVFPAGNGGQVPNISSFDYFNHSYPDLIRDYTTSVRIDAQLPRSMHAFFRENIAPSSASEEANVSDLQGTLLHINTYTAGLTMPIGTRLTNELTGNYTSNNSRYQQFPLSVGGNSAAALQNNLPPGVTSSTDEFLFEICTTTYSACSTQELGKINANQLDMLYVVDVFVYHIGNIIIRFGVDFLSRNVALRSSSNYYVVLPTVPTSPPYSGSDLDTGIMSLYDGSHNIANPNISISNSSLFVNDDWKATPSLTINAGVRWELNPSPTVGPLGALTFGGDNTNLSTFQVAVSTAPLYSTVHSNVAPRFGFAWSPRPRSGTVIRGGLGTYFDTGQAATEASTTASGYPYSTYVSSSEIPYTSINWPNPGGTAETLTLKNYRLVNPHLLSPRTFEWSLTLDQEIKKYAKLTMSYVGNDGEKLVGQDEYYNAENSAGQYPFPTSSVVANGNFYVITNQGHSNYQALQAQLSSRIGQRLTALVSYTWEHAEDNGSNDFATANASIPNIPLANSSNDIPQMFATAVHYAPEGVKSAHIIKAITAGWAFDTIARLQSASPITVVAGINRNQLIYGFTSNANVVAGVPAVLHTHINPYSGQVVPGNKLLNWAAFTAPPVNSSGIQSANGDSPTNGYRLFGLKQWDLAASRSLKIWEGLSLNFRVDAFNILNTANFYAGSGLTNDWNSSNSATFGSATATYASGNGGSVAGDGITGSQVNLFQNGGPRELQLSMKVKF